MTHEGTEGTRIVILGDDRVGKSAMAFCYWLGKWQREEDGDLMDFDSYIPRVGTKAQLSRAMPDTGRRLELVDTSGGEQLGSLISLTYPKADAFIIAYAVDRFVGVLFVDGGVGTQKSRSHFACRQYVLLRIGLRHWST